MTWRRGMGRNTISQIGVGLVFMGVVWGQGVGAYEGLQRVLFGELLAGFDGAETAVVMRVGRPFSTDVQVTVRVARGRAESVALEVGECLECALGRATDLQAEYARLAGRAPRRVVRSMPVEEARALVAEAERVIAEGERTKRGPDEIVLHPTVYEIAVLRGGRGVMEGPDIWVGRGEVTGLVRFARRMVGSLVREVGVCEAVARRAELVGELVAVAGMANGDGVLRGDCEEVSIFGYRYPGEVWVSGGRFQGRGRVVVTGVLGAIEEIADPEAERLGVRVLGFGPLGGYPVEVWVFE